MKKAITLLLIVCLLTTSIIACKPNSQENSGGNADGFPSPTPNAETDFLYDLDTNGNATITEYVGTRIDVVVPNALEGKPVYQIGEEAFAENKDIVSVILPDTVSLVGVRAFWACSSLTTVQLQDGLTQIGNGAFKECTALSQISLPSTLKKLGADAFVACEALVEISLPQSLTHLGSHAFMSSGLEKLSFAENIGISEIPEYAFAATKIKTLFLPASVTKIGASAFEQTPLETVMLNNGLTTLENFAFYGTNIQEIVIPATVTHLTADVFFGCNSLTEVKYEGDAPINYMEFLIGTGWNYYMVYYHEDAEGFTSPTWNNHPTQIW